jgi:hypothetical protein
MSLLENASLVITPNAYNSGKIYAVKPTDGSGDLTVARASTKTRVNPSQLIETIGTNVPSIDYTGGGCPSILVEPQRTNLVFPSASATTQSRNVTAVAHTLSFYGTGTVTLSGVGSGTLVGTGTSNRVTLTFTPTAGILILTVSGSVTSWQLEVGSYATSYIPTTTSAVTRVADAVSKTGISSLIGQTEGVLFIEIKCFENGNVNRVISIYENNTLSNGIQIMIHNTPNYIFFQKYINSVRTTNLAIATFNQANNNKIAFRYSLSGIDIFLNGNKILTNSDSANFTGTLNNLYFSESIGSSKFEGKIKQLQLFKTALSDAELTDLTTP